MERVLEKLKTSDETLKDIADHVIEQCKKVPAFIEKVLNEKKTLEECYDYIVSEARKLKTEKSSCVRVADDVVYGWALHYFQEENLKFKSGKENLKVKKEEVEEIGEAEEIEEKKVEGKKKPIQMSLFDL